MSDIVRIPNPETKIGVIRRYLHVLALLQNYQDATDWNASSLADLLSLEESGEAVSDKSVRDYINKNLMDELGIPVTKIKGGRRTEIDGPLDEEVLARVAAIYSSFVVRDTTREIVLRNLIRRHPVDCLWLLARCHFAALEQRSIIIDYTSNSGNRLKDFTVDPWHLALRNNNLYLVARPMGRDDPWLFIVNRIENLRVSDRHFDGPVPSIEEVFRDTLGSFLGKKYAVLLRFDAELLPVMEQVLSILEPEIFRGEDHRYAARFTVADDRYLCKQLFLYGKQVEICEPPELRALMIEMLHESMAAYRP